MQRIFVLFTIVALAACSTLEPPERTARIPNIPVEKKDCESPLGLIPDGESMTGFLNEYEPVGKSCESGPLTCHDGIWSGSYVHRDCRPGGKSP